MMRNSGVIHCKKMIFGMTLQVEVPNADTWTFYFLEFHGALCCVMSCPSFQKFQHSKLAKYSVSTSSIYRIHMVVKRDLQPNIFVPLLPSSVFLPHTWSHVLIRGWYCGFCYSWHHKTLRSPLNMHWEWTGFMYMHELVAEILRPPRCLLKICKTLFCLSTWQTLGWHLF